MKPQPSALPAPPFTREALAILFARPYLRAFQKAGSPSHYWAPLLSVCSGIRRNEIFFLRPQDVHLRKGVWCLHIAAAAASRGMPGPCTRDIPMHPWLQRLGFLEFVDGRQRSQPDDRLFSEYRAMGEQAGVLFSRNFVHWIKTTKEQLPADQKLLFADDFHFPSLRALFLAEAMRSGMEATVQRYIEGRGDEQMVGIEAVDRAIRNIDIEASFPPLCLYAELMANDE